MDFVGTTLPARNIIWLCLSPLDDINYYIIMNHLSLPIMS